MGRSGRAGEVRSFRGFARNLEALAEWLEAEGVTHVAMEATGVCWKPVGHVLEERRFELMLVNPTQVRKIRRGQRAAVAVGHTILNIAWPILTDNTDYQELGHDHFERRRTPNPDRERQHLTTRLEALGYTVTLQRSAA